MDFNKKLNVIVFGSETYELEYNFSDTWDGYDVKVFNIQPSLDNFNYRVYKHNTGIRMRGNKDATALAIATQISNKEGWDLVKSPIKTAVIDVDIHSLHYAFKDTGKLTS